MSERLRRDEIPEREGCGTPSATKSRRERDSCNAVIFKSFARAPRRADRDVAHAVRLIPSSRQMPDCFVATNPLNRRPPGFSLKGRWIIEGCHYVIAETVTHQLGCSRELREIHRASLKSAFGTTS